MEYTKLRQFLEEVFGMGFMFYISPLSKLNNTIVVCAEYADIVLSEEIRTKIKNHPQFLSERIDNMNDNLTEFVFLLIDENKEATRKRKSIKPKRFHLSAILTVYTGTLCEPTRFNGMDAVLDFTAQFGLELAEDARPYLLKQLPFLGEIDATKFTHVGAKRHIKEIERLTEKYGAYHTLNPIESE